MMIVLGDLSRIRNEFKKKIHSGYFANMLFENVK